MRRLANLSFRGGIVFFLGAGCFGAGSGATSREPEASSPLSRERPAQAKEVREAPRETPRETPSAVLPGGTEAATPYPKAVPGHPAPLDVPGFRPASHVGPKRVSGPMPVTVVLHGNYDRPEWQCDTWQSVAAHRGWVLCPRGTPTPWAPASEDRWHYPGRKSAGREILAGLDALDARYPNLVSRKEMVLAGFSLGAIYAPSLVIDHPGIFEHLFLVEGGVDRIEKWHLRALKRAGVKGIGMAMSSPKYRTSAKALIKKIRKQGMRAVFVDMRGAGHNYRADFVETGRRALVELLGRVE